MSKRADDRKRRTLQIQLDTSHPVHGKENRALVKYAEDLKETGEFKKVARQSLMLYETIGKGDFTLLEEYFPEQWQILRQQLLMEILEGEVIQQLKKIAQQTKPRPMQMQTTTTSVFTPMALPDDDEDIKLEVTKAASTGGNAAQNFLKSMMALQVEEKKEQPKPVQKPPSGGLQSLNVGTLAPPSFEDDDEDMLLEVN